ncbi:MAG TPA: patatin-like phospholipase family protein [Streptosporangiaceae bacterium]
MKNALILAGGGVAGIAWELGVLRGLQDSDPALAARVLAADLVVGTSAGSAVAAQITSGVPLDDLYGRQLSETSAEIEVQLDMEQLLARFTAAVSATASPDEALRAIGALALDTETVAEPVRMTAVAARLPVPDWPDRLMLLPALDALTGQLTAFSKDSGVALADAVAASCAVPGIWPPVTINGHRYIDGGVRSPTNADLAAGYDRILIITPADPDQPVPFGALDEEIERLKPGRVHVVPADAASLAAFGTNPLSPATRGPAARAGREVGRAHAAEVAALWD